MLNNAAQHRHGAMCSLVMHLQNIDTHFESTLVTEVHPNMRNFLKEELGELGSIQEVTGIDSLNYDEHLAQAQETKKTFKLSLLAEYQTGKVRIAIRDRFPFDNHTE